jgi:predicted DNA-binding transcriptional regulator YafY
MSKKSMESSQQVRRILMALKLLSSKNGMTSIEVFDQLKDDCKEVTIRSIQRDLKILLDDGYVDKRKTGKQTIWKLKKHTPIDFSPKNIRESELISFYILKAYINTFRGTTIEKDLNELANKLESMVPGAVFLEDPFYGDQNIGSYDYSDKHEILRLCIKHINEKNWIKIKYERLTDDLVKDYTIFPQFLYTYLGTIYLIAYNPTHKRSTNFAIQNIKSIEEIYVARKTEPKFDYDKFRSERFAVIDGEVEKVSIAIKKEFVKYFENRHIHISQKITRSKSGNLNIELKVPISSDFISWLSRWSNAIADIQPKTLKDELLLRLKNAVASLDV